MTAKKDPTLTPHTWQFAKPWDEKLLKLLSTGRKGPTSGLMGAGGAQVWTFIAVTNGKTRLELKYVRPWEKDAKPAQATNFVVVINSPKAKAKEARAH